MDSYSSHALSPNQTFFKNWVAAAKSNEGRKVRVCMATNMIQSSVPLCLPCSASNDPIEFAFAVPARFLPEIAAVPRKHFCQRSLMSSQHHSSPHFLAWRSSDIYHFQRHVNDHFTAWPTDRLLKKYDKEVHRRCSPTVNFFARLREPLTADHMPSSLLQQKFGSSKPPQQH